MSLAQLKDQVLLLPQDEQRELISFLVAQRQTQERRELLARKIDDNDPSHWITLDDLRKQFADELE